MKSKSMTRSRLHRRFLCLTAVLGTSLGGLGTAVLIEGCSSGSTGGGRVVLQTRVELDPDSAGSFVSPSGWKVTLSRALVSTGEFYYFDGVPPLVLAPRTRSWELAQRWLGLSTAHAHPGHYQAGNALGQMLSPWSVDLLGAAATLGDGAGVTGDYRSAQFSFKAPPVGPAASGLAGHVVVAEGIAEKDGEETRSFRAVADLADVEANAADGQIAGCEFVEADVESDGVVTVRVKPKIWFSLVDFAQAEPGSADEPAEFAPDSQPKIAFSLGVTQLSAYAFSYSKQ